MPGLKSLLPSPGAGAALGLGEAIAVYLIYQSSLPPAVDVRMGAPNDGNIESARKTAAVKSAGLLGIVFLLTRDLNSFIVGGLALGGIDYLYKHHNSINPVTGKYEQQSGGEMVAPSNVYNMPNYGESEAM